jgi:hypothetical protein
MIKELQLPFDLDLPPAQILKAGSLSCMYEMGNLRYICLGKTELVRRVYGAVRNENWTTLPYTIQNENVIINESGFTISYTAIYTSDINLYKADYHIEGKADNSISFSMKGIALASFKRNRIGLCVLHPLKECHNRKAIVTRPDGKDYNSVFPGLVSPSLPFLEMSQLQWATEDNLTVQLHFEGDIFETEDQRNWSDSSYKTYSTRSDIPIPVDVHQGDTIEQIITIHISGTASNTLTELHNETSEVKVPFPQIGYSRSLNGPLINDDTIDWIHKISFDHYRVTIVMNQNKWMHQLQGALTEAIQINTRLELVVYFSDDYKNEITRLTDQLTERQLLVRSILVLQQHHNISSSGLVQYLYPVIKAKLPAVKIGYGTDLIFVDVNQNRPGQIPFDFISFGIHPQAHAFDNRSILENLQNQPDIMKTAMHISGGKPVCISPITLKDRNSGTDERQYSSLAAFWTLISLQNFSEAYSITFYDLFGKAGILLTEQNDNGHSVTIKPSPIYEALSTIYDFQPVWIIKKFTGDELLMDGLLLENDEGDRLFLKGPEEYRIRI